MSTEFQPYVGPRPFERTASDQNRFFGRDDEASELLSRITAHSAVLLYSQSGAGKTSLINAKLTPMLEKAGFEVLKPARVRDVPPADSVLRQISNIYAFNVMTSWDEGRTNPEVLAGKSIADFLQDRKAVVTGEEDGKPRVAILDQFEEVFTSYQERSGDREDFFDQIGAALEEDRLLRVVFAMREDYIAELDPYLALLPEKLRTRYRIERLSEEDALLAITEPLKDTEYSFADGVPEQLVENLLMVPVETGKGVTKVRGESVEPVQLQVVCQTLWENCQNIWRHQPSEKKVITHEYLKTFGDVDQALSTFYESAITGVAKATNIKEGVLRRWFEESLITSAGTRGTVFRGRDDTVGIPNATVDELVNHHVIRAEIRGGSRWYELTHDRFIEPIKASNERWFREHSGGAQLPKRLEERAQGWARDSRQKKDLIDDEGELLVAERWLESTAAADVGYSDTLFAFVQASRAAISEKQAKSARRLRFLVAALVVAVILSGGALVFAVTSRWEAVESRQAAEARAGEATRARQMAEIQKKIADDRSKELEIANGLIQKEQARAEEEGRRAVRQSQIATTNAEIADKARKKVLEYSKVRARLSENELTAFRLWRGESKLQEALVLYKQVLAGYGLVGETKKQQEIQAQIDALMSTLAQSPR